MSEQIVTRTDLAERTGVKEADLDAWIKAKLLKPVGFADEGVPLFGESDADIVGHIAKLSELGYDLEEIGRIVKKFGVPRGTARPKKAPPAAVFLTVGQLAEKTGLSPRTIKHWEEIGIIDPDMRSGGGFRLYAEIYVFLCKLVRDLQLFGYSLEEIKDVSGYFRDFLALKKNLEGVPAAAAEAKLKTILGAEDALREKMALIRDGIDRWEDLLKKNKKELLALQSRNAKRLAGPAAAPAKK